VFLLFEFSQNIDASMNTAPPSPYALICDDHPLVGRGMEELLKAHPMIRGCITTASAEDCLTQAREQEVKASIAILDFWLGEDSCEFLVVALRKAIPDLLILIMSADDDPIVQLKSVEWGANGYINKQAKPGVIREAVLALLQGLSWFTEPDSQNRSPSIRHNQWPISARELGLTARQGQILSLILQGMPNKRIAQQLSLSEATVKEHVTGILGRLGVKSRVEAIAKLQNRRFESC
jgi:DNA-binding NarL/FixJ family response regulator